MISNWEQISVSAFQIFKQLVHQMGSVIICHWQFQTSNIVYRPYTPYRSEGIFQFLERKKKNSWDWKFVRIYLEMQLNKHICL